MAQQPKQQPKTKNEKKAALVASVVVSFNDSYGRDDSKLAIWQRLCTDLDLPVGGSITQCKKILNGVYVNIFDFMAAKQAGRVPQKFVSLGQLREYSKKGKKLFPLNAAKENLMLKALLVQMRGYRR